MVKYFEELLEGFNQANNDTVKNVIYHSMEEFAYSYHPGYTCYDIDMYIVLYKCAKTSKQRKHVFEQIQDIIDDDAFQTHEELIKNLREVVSLTEFLKEEDEEKFDLVCTKSLDFFKKQLSWSRAQARCGQSDFIPDTPLNVAEDELKEVAEIIVSADKRNSASYQDAAKILGN